MTHALDTLPHTGAMYYEEGIDSVPSAAISTVDASYLANQLKANPDLEVVLEMNCHAFPDVEQGNVIGEWRGSELPNEIITLVVTSTPGTSGKAPTTTAQALCTRSKSCAS